MSTPLQRLTARRNSRKSTGPRTSAGRVAVSQNAVRHGLLANTVVLQGESQDRFLELSQNFNNELQPQNETEKALVDMLCAARWRQTRLWGIERAIIAQEVMTQLAAAAAHDPHIESCLDHSAKVALGFRALADSTRVLDLLNRYESANSRLFFRALQNLTNLRAEPHPEPELEAQKTKQSQKSTFPNRINHLPS